MDGYDFRLSAPRLFVVDDDYAVRDAQEALLLAQGYDVAGFSSGEAMLAALPEAGPACIILDLELELPGLTGVEVVERLPASRRGAVVVVSGSATPAVRERLRQAGVAALFEKPAEPDDLLDAVADLIARG